MDTLSELPPQVPRPPQSLSRGRSSKKLSGSSMGGGSKSERRLLMEAKAGVGAAIAEVRVCVHSSFVGSALTRPVQ